VVSLTALREANLTHISGNVTYTVYLGQGSVGSTLIVDTTGSITPTANGASGVVSDVTGGRLTNHGTISGSQFGSQAGIGVDMMAAGTVANTGLITGGNSIYGAAGSGLNLLAGGLLTNAGTIEGGYSTAIGSNTDVGGTGVDLGASGQVHNTGTISGGYGGSAYNRGDGGAGGAGLVMQAGGALANTGHVSGGDGGYAYFSGTGAGGAGVTAVDTKIGNAGAIGGGSGVV